MAREYFAAYHSYLESIEPLNDAERGRLFAACLGYSKSGAEPKLEGNERFIWPTIRAQIERDKKNYDERCQANRQNAKRRYAKESDRMRTSAKTAKEKEKEKEKETEKEKTKTKTTEKEKENNLSFPGGKEREGAVAPSADKPRRSLCPTLGEIKTYCLENGYKIDAQRFYDFYEAKGWRIGSSPMKNWQAAVRTWAGREAEKKKEEEMETGNPFKRLLMQEIAREKEEREAQTSILWANPTKRE